VASGHNDLAKYLSIAKRSALWISVHNQRLYHAQESMFRHADVGAGLRYNDGELENEVCGVWGLVLICGACCSTQLRLSTRPVSAIVV
jgi:hypothetical protein